MLASIHVCVCILYLADDSSVLSKVRFTAMGHEADDESSDEEVPRKKRKNNDSDDGGETKKGRCRRGRGQSSSHVKGTRKSTSQPHARYFS